MRANRPVLFLDEGLDLALALHDEAQRHRLNATGGEATAHLVPQQGRHLVAHQAIEDAAGLLRIHQVAVDVAGVQEGVLNGLLGDFVEGDAADVGYGAPFLSLLAVNPVPAQFLRQVGGNRLAFAVRVRRQVDRFRRLRQLLQPGDDLLFAGNYLVFGRKLVVQIDPERLLGQILNVPERGFDLEPGT